MQSESNNNTTQQRLNNYHDRHDPDTPRTIADWVRSQWNSEDKSFFTLKIALVIIGLALLTIDSTINLIHHTAPVECFQDLVQDWALPVTKYLEENVNAKNVLMAVASLTLDINIILLGLRYILYGKSLRLYLMILAFYLFRGIIQRIFSIRFPDNYIFAFPGVFSVAVPYFATNDFFFSGHIGISFIIFLEYKKDKASILLQAFALFTLLLNILNMIFTEGHYSIDLATGIITAHYIYILGLWVEPGLINLSDKFFDLFRSKEKSSKQEEKEDPNENDPKIII